MSIKDAENQLERAKRDYVAYVSRTDNVGLFGQNKVINWVRDKEALIHHIETCDLTFSELERCIAELYRKEIEGGVEDAKVPDAIQKYLHALIERKKAAIALTPPDAREVTGTAHYGKLQHHAVRFKLTFTARKDPDRLALRDAAGQFVIRRHSRLTIPRFPYSARRNDDLSGTECVHLVEKELRQQFPEADIRVFNLDMGDAPPPPPPPPKGAQIAPDVYLEDRLRDKHIYLLGKSGKGKSTLMLNMARQDVESGKGVCVIDPHGDFADKLLRYVPASRVSETVYFNPATCPIGLSTLNAINEEEKPLIVDDCLILFRRLSPESWGPRMDAILRYTIHTLLEVPGVTFLDIMRLLTDSAWRQTTILAINRPEITTFWEHVYPTFPRDAANPILTRMSLFHLSPFIAKTLGSRSTFQFYDHLQRGGIFIANIAGIGQEAARLLGSVLVSQVQLVATRRARLPEDARTPCYLYVDEFQHFQSSAFGEIIAESRKFKLFLTMGNQKLADLDPQTYDSIEGVGASIYFNLNPSDAARVSRFTPRFEADAFMNLDDGEVIVRPAKARDSFVTRLSLPPKATEDPTGAIIQRTQMNYAPVRREGEVVSSPMPSDSEPGPSSPPPK